MLRLFFTLFAVLFVFHPQLAANKLKYGKVSKEEIELTECAYDKEASGVILNYTGRISVSSANVVIVRHVRFKVLADNGVDIADVNIPFYAKEGYEKIYSIKAQTINFDENGKAEITEVDKKNFFEADLSEEWKEMRFTFPNVKVGSILEYEYELASENHLYLDNWVFQNELPTLHSELTVEIPQYLDYKLLLQGFRLITKYRNEATNHWELDDLPAIKDESYLFNQQDFLEMLKFQLAGYYAKADMGGVEYKSLRTTWEKLADEVLNSYEYRSYLNKSGYAKNVLSTLNLEGHKPEEKLRIIYNYVASHYSWNGKYRRFTYNKLSDITENSKAHSSEINLLLTLLLNQADIEADPMLISTRSNGMYSKDYPFLTQFNHLITYVKIEEKEYFLDAIDPYLPFDVLPAEDIISEGFVLDKRNPRWVSLKEQDGAKEFYRVTLKAEGPGQLNTKLLAECDGLSAEKFRRQISDDGESKWSKKLLKANGEIDGDSVVVDNVEEVDKSLSASVGYNSQIDSGAGGDVLYINPFVLSAFKENPFNNDVRYYPVQFASKFSFKYIAVIHLPEGYKATDLPKSEKIQMPNNYCNFTYYVSNSSDRDIAVQVFFNINVLEVPAIQYSNLKEFYDIVVSRVNQQIVLKKL